MEVRLARGALFRWCVVARQVGATATIQATGEEEESTLPEPDSASLSLLVDQQLFVSRT